MRNLRNFCANYFILISALSFLLSGCETTFKKSDLDIASEHFHAFSNNTSSGSQITYPANLIDNFEDGNETIITHQGRSGRWYIADDGSAISSPSSATIFTPSTGGPGTSAYAGHFAATNFTIWGGQIGFNFIDNGSGAPPVSPTNTQHVDLSTSTGIGFWAKIGAGATTNVNVAIGDINTVGYGGLCIACWDRHFQTVALTTTWTYYTVTFASLAQAGWGNPLGPFDPTKVFDVAFIFGTGVVIDFWVDDIQLIP